MIVGMKVGTVARCLMQEAEKFTVTEIGDQLVVRFPELSAAYLRNTVVHIRSSLTKRGKIEIVTPGSPLKSGVYRWKR